VYISHRLARRFHLTEEIGARRRDLYATDIFLPVDKDFHWSYKNPDFKCPERDHDAVLEEVESPLSVSQKMQSFKDPIRAVVNPTILKMCIQLDSWQWRAMNQPESVSPEDFVAWKRENESTTLCSSGESYEPLLDEYLCIYHKYNMDNVLTKLIGVCRESQVALRIIHYHRLFALPPSVELTSLGEVVSRLLTTKETPKSLHGPVVVVSCFLNHPIVRSVMSIATSDTVLATKATVSKKDLKKIRSLLPKESADFIADIIKTGKLENVSQVYRMELVMSDTSIPGEALELLRKLVPGDSAPYTARWHAENELLKNSLFSINS
jgi:hypothetical protein